MANDAGPEAKQWALAATAILTTMTRQAPRYDLLGGAPKPPGDNEGVAKTILTNSWGVDSRDQLIKTLEFLGSMGHSAEYQKAAAAFQQAPPPARQQDPALAFVNQYGAEIGNRGLLAWDLGRLLAVAGWGYLAGYCSEEEAWGAILSSGVRLRGAYGSWDEYAKHYRLGLLFFDAGATGQLDQVLAQIMASPNSPWRAVAWSLDGAPGGAVAATQPAGGLPPGQPGAPPAYGNVPVIAPVAPPGQPGAPAAYGNVPVIAPPPGGAGPYPPGAMGPGGAGGNKKGLLIGVGVGGLLVLILIIGGVVHLMHRHEAAHEAPPAHESGKHGKH